MKRLLKRRLFAGLSLCIVVLTVLRSWAGSEIEGSSLDISPDDDPAPEPKKGPARELPRSFSPVFSAATITLTGTVIRNGAHFVLRETDGLLYTLDSVGRAWAFEGEEVRVTGKLDSSSRLFHIEVIESLAA